MSEQSEPSASETQKNNAPIGVIATLFLFGFLPFCLLSASFTEPPNVKMFTVLLIWIVYLASIAFTIILIRFALRSWDDKKKVRGFYSVLFGGLPILFSVILVIGLSTGYDGFLSLVALPAIFVFPIIGLILGLIGFRDKWGKIGLFLVVVNFVLWATGFPWDVPF